MFRNARWIAFGLAACSSSAACNLDNPGVSPPAGMISYPIALALGKPNAGDEIDVLYVVNSNFDLAYNAGSVHAYDLSELDDAIDAARCEYVGVPDGGLLELPEAGVDGAGDVPLQPGGEVSAPGPEGADATLLDPIVDLPPNYEIASHYGTLRGILCDGRDPEGDACCFKDSARFLKRNGEILIDSYATGLALSPDARRLYVPLRATDTLLFLDANEAGELSCGELDGGRCRSGVDSSDPSELVAESYPVLPQALAVGALSGLAEEADGKVSGTFIVTAHDNGEMALLVDEGDGPVLHSTFASLSPPGTAVQLAPDERLLYSASAVSTDDPRIANDPFTASLLRWGIVRDADDERWILYPSTSVSVRTALINAYDIRDLRIDDENPMRLFALMRGEVGSVLFIERNPSAANEGIVTHVTRVGAGPARLEHAVLGGRRLLLVSCFNEPAIFVIDERTTEVAAVIRGLSGPFDMEVDEARQRLYVADFRANVLRVVDVRGLSDARLSPPRIIATLGQPSFGGRL